MRKVGKLVMDLRNCAELARFSKATHNQLTEGVSLVTIA